MGDGEPSLFDKGRGCRGGALQDVTRLGRWRRSVLMHIGDRTGWFNLVMAIRRSVGSLERARGGSFVGLRGMVLIVVEVRVGGQGGG